MVVSSKAYNHNDISTSNCIGLLDVRLTEKNLSVIFRDHLAESRWLVKWVKYKLFLTDILSLSYDAMRSTPVMVDSGCSESISPVLRKLTTVGVHNTIVSGHLGCVGGACFGQSHCIKPVKSYMRPSHTVTQLFDNSTKIGKWKLQKLISYPHPGPLQEVTELRRAAAAWQIR